MLTLLWLACAPPDASEATLPPHTARDVAAPEADIPFEAVGHRAGQAWRWADVEIAVVRDAAQWEEGIYIRRGDDTLSLWSERPWASEAGWLPMLWVRPDAEPFTVGDTIVFQAIGSDAYGCDAETWVFISLRDLGGEVGVTIEIEGAPLLALPAEGWLVAVNGVPHEEPLPPGGAALELVAVSQLELVLAWGEVTMSAPEPLPLLRLQGQDDFLALDVARSCAQAGVERVRMTWEVVL